MIYWIPMDFFKKQETSKDQCSELILFVQVKNFQWMHFGQGKLNKIKQQL